MALKDNAGIKQGYERLEPDSTPFQRSLAHQEERIEKLRSRKPDEYCFGDDETAGQGRLTLMT